MLTDTHAHLYWDSFKEDFDQMIQRTLDAGVTNIVNVGVDVEKSKLALKQVQNQLSQVDGLTAYSTIGLHPHLAVDYLQKNNFNLERFYESIREDVNTIEEIYLGDTQKVIAVGECGLDYLFDPEHTPPTLSFAQIIDLQKFLFQSQIDLAKKHNLLLIVHCRDDRTKNPNNIECWLECLKMVKDYHGILHCYSGTMEITKQIPANFLVSFAANITYPKNEYLRETIKFLPLEKIVLETDCPFLAHQSNRGQRNEPSSVKEIAELISEIKGVALDKVAKQTTANFNSLFNLS